MGTSKELPKYKCHKEVWALKIKRMEAIRSDSQDIVGTTMFFEEEGYSSIEISGEYFYKHKPKIGGYYVVYEDGYTSYSPAEAFEGGYSKVEPEVVREGRKYRLQKLYLNNLNFKIGDEVYYSIDCIYFCSRIGDGIHIEEVENYPDYWKRIK